MRQDVGVGAADVAEQGQPRLVGGGLGHGERDAEYGVGPEPALVRRPVEIDQRGVDRPLVHRFETFHRVGDLAVDVGDGPQDALAPIPRATTAGTGAGSAEHLVAVS